ncbi:hypothetical protein BIW11_03937 [Tropilaelaps mercedesae]|uniref:Uncharacterized protein n=1 Tax=Tropilaelaps mercedesae TaxID=418985 RepID=A0A1V9XDJ0_9ACAR|nr:hypothetical protein BIW11_03937 [Tropilaelaps mercedesae]
MRHVAANGSPIRRNHSGWPEGLAFSYSRKFPIDALAIITGSGVATATIFWVFSAFCMATAAFDVGFYTLGGSSNAGVQNRSEENGVGSWDIVVGLFCAIVCGYVNVGSFESVGPSKRAMVSMSGDFGWLIGFLTFSPVAYWVATGK